MRYLGIDYGSKRVGLALSDEARTMGFPHAIIPNTPRLADDVCALVMREKVGAIVIGESRDLAGNENKVAAAARAFGDAVAKRTSLSVFYEPEMFTSAAARRPPAKEPKSRAAQRHAPVDAAAAALILTSFLEKQRS